MPQKLELVVDHYHKTYDLAYRIWEGRNRTFLYLIGTVALAVLVIQYPALGEFLVKFAVKKGDLPSVSPQTGASPELDGLLEFTSNTLLNAVMLMVIFFLMSNLLKDTLNIIRLYKYIDGLEREIKHLMDLGPNSVAFTRESSFYWDNRQHTHVLVKYFYAGMLAILLGVFLILRVSSDLPRNPDWRFTELPWLAEHLPFLLDVIIGIPIVILFVGYAKASIWSDQQPAAVIRSSVV